jgi:hypothetical protein
VQVEIVHSPDTQDAVPRESRAHSVHESAARGTKEIGHCLPRADCVRLAESLQGILAAQMLKVCVCHGEIGCEHGGCDLAAVNTVADESVN